MPITLFGDVIHR